MEPDYLSLLNEVRGEITPPTITPPSVVASTPPPVTPPTAPQSGPDYLSILNEVRSSPNAPPNPDKVFQSMSEAVGSNPANEARRKAIADKLGTQPVLLPSTPEAEAMLKRKEIQDTAPDVAQNSPLTARWLLTGDNSKLVGNDLSRLRKMEADNSDLAYLGRTIEAGGLAARAAINKFAEAALPFLFTPESELAVLSKTQAELDKLRAQPGAALGTTAKNLNVQSEAIMQGITPEQKARLGSKEYFTTDPEKAAYLDPVKVLGDVLLSAPSTAIIAATWVLAKGAGKSAQLEARASGATPEVARQAGIAAIVKTAQSIGATAEGAITYGQNSLNTAAEVERMTFDKISKDPEYQKYWQLGYEPTVIRTLLAGKAGEMSGTLGGLSTATISGIGGQYLGRIIGEGGAFLPRMLKAGGTEALTEATQSPLETAAGNLAIKTYADKTQEVTAGMAESMAQGGILGGITGSAVAGFAGRNQAADAATASRDSLEKMAMDAASNPIAEHSPDAYRDFINSVTEGQPTAEVYVDTNSLREVFAQAGVNTKELEQALPEVLAQLNDETNSEGFIRIPTSDLLTRVKTPEILKSILDNARVMNDTELGMSFKESEAFFQTQHEQFSQEVVKAAETKARVDQHEKDIREIRQTIADELYATGRFDKTVAATNAMPIAAFYEQRAKDFGGTVTAKQLFEQYPYQAQNEDGKNEKIKYLADTTNSVTESGQSSKVFTANATTESEPEVKRQLMVDDKGNYIWSGSKALEGTALIPATFKTETELKTAVEANPLIVKRKSTTNKKGKYSQVKNAEFEPTTLMSTFLKGANLSSIIHEAGHFYLEMMERLASRPDAPQKIKDDFNLYLDWFGVTPEQWAGMGIKERTPYHEQFAQSQELWMLEGKSPTLNPKMQSVFGRFRQWMLSVYKSVEQFLQQNPLAGKLNDEVRAAFSRLIASEEAVMEAEKIRGYVPLFQTAEQADAPQDVFDKYLKENADATQQSVDAVQKRSMRDLKWLSNAKSAMLKKIQSQAKGFRDAIREEVTTQVMNEPINQAKHFLLTGETIDLATGEKQKADKFKLNTADLEGMAEDPHLKGMISSDGLNPDIVAMQFGYSSGDAMLYDLVHAENAQEKIDGITEQRMLQEHGEMIDARAIEEAVNAAIVNDARSRFLASGLKILTKTGAPISQITKAAKLAAEERIAQIPLEKLRPAQYAAVERRANVEALANAGKDPAKAIAAQRAAILNNQLYKAAIEAQEEIQTGAARAIRATKPAAQKAMGGEHLLQLNALLDRFGFRSKNTLLTQTTPRSTLADYVATEQRRNLGSYFEDEEKRLTAVTVDVPAWITSEQVSQDYNSLTLEQFRELMDAVKSIEILARRERDQYMSIRGQTFEEEKAANLARLRAVHPQLFTANGRLKPRAAKQVATIGRAVDEKVEALHAELYNFESIVNVLEGGELGPLHESLTSRVSTRQDWKLARMEGIYKIIEPLLEQYSKLERRSAVRKDIGMEILGFEMTLEGAVMVALYHGSTEGRNRLENHGWNLATQQKIIDLLDPRGVKLVNGIWKLFDESLWPELKALNERTKGKAPPKVEAVPYKTRSGDMTGGYFELKYDSAISTSPQSGGEAVNGLLGRTPSGRATTAQGTSTAREENVGMNKHPRLDFNVLFESVNEIVNDLTYREAVADTQRMLLDPEMELAIKAASSEKEYNALKHRIGAVVMGAQEPTVFVERMASAIRKNTVVVLMSGTYTALQNYLNFISVSHRLDSKANLAVEILRMHGPTGPAAYRFAVKNSEYLRLRHLSYDRSLQENSKKFTIDEPLMPQMSTWLWLMGMTDRIVSTTTWNAAYKEGMAKHANDNAKAVEYADHIVRQTLGSGRDFDISQMQEGHLRQLLVMFYSFANSQLQMQMRNATLSKREWTAGHKAKAASMAVGGLLSIVIMPAIFNDIALTLLRGDPQDDDEDLVARAAKDAALYQMSFVPGLRDVGAYYFREVADMNSYGFKLSPIESTIVGVGKGAKAGVKIWNDEGDTKATGDAIMGLSYALGLPGLMIKNAVVGAGAWVDDTAGPEALLFGPPKELKH